MDVIVYNTNESGELAAGWHRVRAGNVPAFLDQMIADGLDARRSLPPGDPQRQVIGKWVDYLGNKDFLPTGNYPLAGKAVIHVEDASARNCASAQSRSRLITAQMRRKGIRTATRTPATPQSAAAAIAKAKKALAA